MKECSCNDWKENIGKLNTILTLSSLRSGGRDGYTGKFFQYCPWCGTKGEKDDILPGQKNNEN